MNLKKIKPRKTIGKILKYIRLKSGLSIRSLSAAIDIAPGTVQKFEAGYTKASPNYIRSMHPYMDKEDEQLLTFLIGLQELRRYYLDAKYEFIIDPYKITEHSLTKRLLFVDVIDLSYKGLTQRQIAQTLKLTTGQVQYVIDNYKAMRGA